MQITEWFQETQKIAPKPELLRRAAAANEGLYSPRGAS